MFLKGLFVQNFTMNLTVIESLKTRNGFWQMSLRFLFITLELIEFFRNWTLFFISMISVFWSVRHTSSYICVIKISANFEINFLQPSNFSITSINFFLHSTQAKTYFIQSS